MSIVPQNLQAAPEQPYFSIVMPAYNAAAHIARAVTSVLAQTHALFELIIIDDGSTDSTLSVLASLTDSRIRIVSQENTGVSSARNTGIKHAKYHWIAFLDSDDEWSPHFLQSAASAIFSYPDATALFADYELKSLEHTQPADSTQVKRIENYLEYIAGRHYRGAHTSTTVVSRAALETSGMFPDGVKYGEDKDLWMRLSWVGYFVHIQQPLGSYHQDNPDSAMNHRLLNQVDPPPTLHSFTKWKQAEKIPENKIIATERYVARENLTYAIWLLQLGEAEKARIAFQQHGSVTYFPVVTRTLSVVSRLIPQRIIRFSVTLLRKSILPWLQKRTSQ